jgi:hypothetical protein
MTNTTAGIAAIGDYATPSGDPAKVQALLDLIANTDNTSSSGATAGGASNSYLDEMSPAAAIQLRVELTALKAAVT